MLSESKIQEICDMIDRHVPADGRGIRQSTVIARVQKDYTHDSDVSDQDIVDTFMNRVQRGVYLLEKGSGGLQHVRRRLVEVPEPGKPEGKKPDREKPAPTLTPIGEPLLPLAQAVREVAPGIIEGEVNSKATRMSLVEALAKAVQRDEFLELRRRWNVAFEEELGAERDHKRAREVWKGKKEKREGVERKLRYYGFESETTRKQDEKRKKQKARTEEPPENHELFTGEKV